MAHHAYFFAGDREAGIEAALAYARNALGLGERMGADVIVERYGLFSVSDARRVMAKAELAPAAGDQKIIVLAVNRIFHEAQNALLKLFEEPPRGTTLVLVLPSEGDLLHTLRSRLQPLAAERTSEISAEAAAFIAGGEAVRAKLIAGILDDAKSDKDEEKQEARAKALRLAEGLARAAYEAWRKEAGPDSRNSLQSFLADLDRLIPVLHDRSAPLKSILEHLLIVAPARFADRSAGATPRTSARGH